MAARLENADLTSHLLQQIGRARDNFRDLGLVLRFRGHARDFDELSQRFLEASALRRRIVEK